MTNNKLTLIAEIGLNHNGNFDLNFELIKQAKNSGADFIKFQFGWREKKDELNYLDEDRIRKLYDWAKYFEIKILFSVFNKTSYEVLRKFKPNTIKIASRTLIDSPKLVQEIIKNHKNVFISLGMWDKGLNKLPYESKNISYMWCKSKYPCSPWDIIGLPKQFLESKYIGYSDHTIGIEACLIAISRGARIIEKHFTLDKSDTTIRDHALSATPNEFLQLSRIGRDIFEKIKIGV